MRISEVTGLLIHFKVTDDENIRSNGMIRITGSKGNSISRSVRIIKISPSKRTICVF
jgi:hypothetical protein